MLERVILHCDLNNFFASVELLDKPQLKDKPVAVCGSREERHGIVLAKNYEAKKFNVKTAETIWQAKEKCPNLIILEPNYDKYLHYSRLVRSILYEYTDLVESFGLDESWLDVTGSMRLFGSGEKIANTIRKRIKAQTGLTVSVGVSFNKVFAKLGSDMKKPNAVTVIPKNGFREMIYSLPASDMIGIGKHTKKALDKLGISTIGDLARSDVRVLKSHLGIGGEKIWYFANGLDFSPVVAEKDLPDIKSVSRSTTPKADLENNSEIWQTLTALGEDVARSLYDNDFYALKITAMVRDTSLNWVSFAKTLKMPLRVSSDISREAMNLFLLNYDWKTPVHSIGIAASELISSKRPVQLSLFSDFEKQEKKEKLESEVFYLRDKYRKNIIVKASLLDFSASPSIKTLPGSYS